MRALAIDPHTASIAVAMQVPASGPVVLTFPPGVQYLLRCMPIFRRAFGIGLVLYEDCYLSKNAKTYAQLFHVRETVREAVESSGMRFMLVTASQWQAPLLLKKGESLRKINRVELKARARTLAVKLSGANNITQDQADALCILHAFCTSVLVIADENPKQERDRVCLPSRKRKKRQQ